MDTSPNSSITLEFLYCEIQILKTSIQSSKADIFKVISDTKDEIIENLQTENELLKKSITKLKNEVYEKDCLVTDIEKDLCELQQYVRRNNMEITGIPEDIPDDLLEAKVIEIGHAMDITINETDFEACHRLPKGKHAKASDPRRTIVRFVNRKVVEKMHRNKKILRTEKHRLENIGLDPRKIYLNNNLCPYYRMLWGECKSLYKDGKISSFWIYNGTVRIKKGENSAAEKILHYDDLEYLKVDVDK